MKQLKCILVDDEELARTLLSSYIDKIDFLELLGSFENPIEALKVIRKGDVDVLFLDIQMPELKGTDFAKLVPEQTKVIFTTAYSEYAIQGFELSALDYLLKPITFERFLAAINKVETTSKQEQINKVITIKSGYVLHKVKLDAIKYIESDSEYVIYHTKDKKIMSNQSLKTLEKTLPVSVFLRVHRSFIINRNYVTELKGRDLYLAETIIPVSDSYYEIVKKELF